MVALICGTKNLDKDSVGKILITTLSIEIIREKLKK